MTLPGWADILYWHRLCCVGDSLQDGLITPLGLVNSPPKAGNIFCNDHFETPCNLTGFVSDPEAGPADRVVRSEVEVHHVGRGHVGRGRVSPAVPPHHRTCGHAPFSDLQVVIVTVACMHGPTQNVQTLSQSFQKVFFHPENHLNKLHLSSGGSLMTHSQFKLWL